MFQFCSACARCCVGEFVVALTPSEEKRFGGDHLSIDGFCSFLGEKGCTLGDRKPLDCFMYPLILRTDGLYLDIACPLGLRYQQDLIFPNTEATAHLLECKKRIKLAGKAWVASVDEASGDFFLSLVKVANVD